MTHFMIDLETLGTHVNSVILSVGIAAFDKDKILERFYEKISIDSCVDSEMTVTADTLRWWYGQKEDIRKDAFSGVVPLKTVLHRISEFIYSQTRACNAIVWGNGASFDLSMLSEAYRKCYVSLPWKFWNERCFRTIRAFSGVTYTPPANAHNALTDAESQAGFILELAKQGRLKL